MNPYYSSESIKHKGVLSGVLEEKCKPFLRDATRLLEIRVVAAAAMCWVADVIN